MTTKNSRVRKGFTLVELLAVIVILAIILVIAVPKVMSVIEDAKMGTLESTAKMIASAAEKQKVQNTVLGKEKEITCDSVAKINKGDYASCSIEFVDNTALVTIKGSGKFDGLYVCDGNKTNAIATTEECVVPVVYRPIFADNSWATIATACENNEVPETWNLGDTKPMQIGDYTVNIRIIGKNHDNYADGSGTAPLTFETAAVLGPRAMYDEETDVYNYENTDMRNYLNNTLINELEGGIGAKVKEVTKKTLTSDGISKGTTTTTSDKLFILSAAEVYDVEADNFWAVYAPEGTQYAYYASCPENVAAETNYYALKSIAGTDMSGLEPEEILNFLDNFSWDNPEDVEKKKQIAQMWMLRTPAKQYGPALHSASLMYGIPGLSLGGSGDNIRFNGAEYFSFAFCF